MEDRNITSGSTSELKRDDHTNKPSWDFPEIPKLDGENIFEFGPEIDPGWELSDNEILNLSPEVPSKPQGDGDDTFGFFPKLPAELREMIWMFALPGPRVLEFCSFLGGLSRPAAKAPHRRVYHLLSVCQEAKSIISQHYKPIKLSELKNYPACYHSVMLADFKRDLFYFPNDYISIVLGYGRSRFYSYMKNVRNIALQAKSINRWTTPDRCIPRYLDEFNSLQEITFTRCNDDKAIDELPSTPLICISGKDEDVNPEFDIAKEKLSLLEVSLVYQKHNIKISFATLERLSPSELST